jgi:uncharacterized tellurite resistance protein B-like protein
MIDRFLALIAGDAPEAGLAPDDARLAIAAVLVGAARADGDYDDAERARIDRILAKRFGLTPWQASALRGNAEEAERRSTGLVEFTRAIKQAVPHAERVGVIEAVWEIAYADGERSHEEAALVRKLAGLLYVEDRDAGLARQRVAARLGLE